MNVSFEIPQDIEQQFAPRGWTPIARLVKRTWSSFIGKTGFLMPSFVRRDVSFDEAERLIKEHGAGHDIDIEEFEAGRDLLRKARPQ